MFQKKSGFTMMVNAYLLTLRLDSTTYENYAKKKCIPD